MNGLMDAKCVKYNRLDLFPEIVYNECCKDSVKSELSQNVYCIVGLGRSQRAGSEMIRLILYIILVDGTHGDGPFVLRWEHMGTVLLC